MSDPREQEAPEEDFVWVTPLIIPEHFTCPNCRAKAGEECVGPNAPWGSHLERHRLAEAIRGMA
jgi:hypothetical protein